MLLNWDDFLIKYQNFINQTITSLKFTAHIQVLSSNEFYKDYIKK